MAAEQRQVATQERNLAKKLTADQRQVATETQNGSDKLAVEEWLGAHREADVRKAQARVETEPRSDMQERKLQTEVAFQRNTAEAEGQKSREFRPYGSEKDNYSHGASRIRQENGTGYRTQETATT